MKVAGFLVVASLVASGCATSHVSSARFVSRAPSGGVVATPAAEVGMDDANSMIAAHCGSGGYSITREGEALVGSTVVTEGANSVDAQTTEGAGQVQQHDNSKTVYATGSNWQVHYTCNDPRTVNMGLITRSRTEPSKLAWGADVGAGAMLLAGHAMEETPTYSETRGGAGTALAGNVWLGFKLSPKFVLGGGLGMASVIAMPQWDRTWDNGAQREVVITSDRDATAIELFATAKYAIAERVDLGVRVGLSEWRDVSVDGATPLAAFQLGYRVIDVGASSGVYVAAGISSYFSSSLTNNVTPALSVVAEPSERPAKLPTLAELYEAHRQHVYSVAFKYCGGRADAAEDVTANVFMRANDFLPNLDPTLDVRGWLYRVTKNAALSHVKSESRWRRRTFAFLQGRPTEAADPESTMSERQLADLAWQEISAFPTRERTIAVLAFVDGQSQTEIARELDVSEATVSRSLAKIRSRVAAKGWTV